MDALMVAEETSTLQGAPPAQRRILIVRLGAMGDILHAMPAVQMIRHANPKTEIGWVVEKRWVPLLCAPAAELAGDPSPQRPLANTVHAVDTRAWRKSLTLPTTWHEVSASLGGVRARGYDLAIDVQGAIKSGLVARLSRSEAVWGFKKPREGAATLFYTDVVECEAAHVVDQNIELVSQATGASGGVPDVLLPVHLPSEAWVEQELLSLNVQRFALLAPTAGWGAKEWPPARFGEVATALAARGVTPLINFGPGEEAVAAEVQQASGGVAKPFPCDLSQLISLTRRASLFIGGDTGPMHLAAALKVPVVALFGPTDPARNGPYGTRSKILRSAESVTSYSHIDVVDAGLMKITISEVIAAAEELLN